LITPEQFRKVEEIFHKAIDIDRSERSAFLDAACGDDPVVRAEVERLLDRDERDDRPDLTAGDLVGPYRIGSILGEGGMGVVYEAEQEEPVRRMVALKLIRAGMDTRQVTARFDSERQALAMMDHPGIARVLDAGSTADGRPYFVLERVDGIPVTRYCEEHRLDNKARLELFRSICDAVQHAHQKGIIHRDLKPSNVLVTEVDGKPVPKVIDFGIAKAVEQPLTEKTLFTRLGQFVGTPEYMSPEQAGAGGGDVDTRTDVYSLGVLLYELLSGELPFDPESLREAGIDEIRRHIRESDPPRPSTRTGEGRRDTDPGTLTRQLRGDLDWITLRALEKDRERRYPSASELAADVERYLRHEPVLAGPPSVSYRFGKFVRRHRVMVTAAVLVAGALLLGVAGTTTGLIRAREAERRAMDEAASSRQVADFMVDLFKVSDPGEARGNSITAREILDQGSEKIGEGLEKRPLVQARLMETMGKVYSSLGLFPEAEPLLKEALELRRSEPGVSGIDLASNLEGLATLRLEQGDYEEAVRLAEEAISLLESEVGPDDPSLSPALNAVGVAFRQAGDLEAAKPYYVRALAILESELGSEHLDLAPPLNNLARLYVTTGDLASARPLYERSLGILEQHRDPDHPDIARLLNNLGSLLLRMKEYDDARPYYERCREILEGALGPDHPVVGTILVNLGHLERRTGNHDEALELFQRSLAISEQALGPDHADVGTAHLSISGCLTDLGDLTGARQHAEKSVEILEKALGPDHPDLARALHTLGGLVEGQDETDQGQGMIRRAVKIMEAALGPDHEETIRFREDVIP
jgi:serine/threonine protein kinase/tetratricopeptide (TPR) repeat protein